MTKTNKEPFSKRIAKLFSWPTQKVRFGFSEDSSRNDLPEINAGDQNLPRVTNQAWSAIEKANHPPYLFRYGDVPCRLEHNDTGVLVVRQLTQDRLRYEVAGAAVWFRWRSNSYFKGFTQHLWKLRKKAKKNNWYDSIPSEYYQIYVR